jgi:hypothetical protein
VPSRMIRAQDALSFDDAAERFGAKRQIHSLHQGREQDLLTLCSHNSSFTLEQVSSVVKTRVTSPVRRCGPGHPLRARLARW